MKNVATTILFSTLFNFGCAQQNQVTQTDQANSFDRTARTSVNQDILEDLEIDGNTPDLSEGEIMLAYLHSNYNFSPEELETLAELHQKLQCEVSGVEVGVYNIQKENKTDISGLWKNVRLNIELQVMDYNQGKYYISNQVGKLKSSERSFKSTGSITQLKHTKSFMGKWSQTKKTGEFVGLHLDDDNQSMVSFWTTCDS